MPCEAIRHIRPGREGAGKTGRQLAVGHESGQEFGGVLL
jgi:hypothetical protein